MSNSETPARPDQSRTKPWRGGRLLPQMTPKDMMSYEPDPEVIDKLLGRPPGKEAGSNGRDPFQRQP